MTKRRAPVLLLLIGMVAASGCLGFITGSEAATFEAEDVTVSSEARSSAGYSQERDDTFTTTRQFSVAGQSREVKATNHISEYDRSVDLPLFDEQQLARVSVISSPGVKLAGRTLSPLGHMSNRQLAEQFQQKYATISDVRFVSNRTVEIQGEGRTVDKFAAKAKIAGGREADVYLHIVKYQDGEDFIVAIAVYPQSLDGEQSNVDTMLSGIQHPV